MGVQVALELWNHERDRVEGMALLCGSFEDPVSTFRDGNLLRNSLGPLKALTQLGGQQLDILLEGSLRRGGGGLRCYLAPWTMVYHRTQLTISWLCGVPA